MKKVKRNIIKEITSMELVDTKFISEHGKSFSTNLTHESMDKNVFVELFSKIELEKLFGQKIFSRN